MPGGPLEKDTCRDYVLPRLKAAGWSDDQIAEQFPITDGRILTIGRKHRRARPLRADYVLEYQPGVPIAVVEAKREYAIPGKGLQAAKNYARLLDLPFAYSTNGKGIVEDDRDTGLESDKLAAFPSPAALWSRYRRWKGIVEDMVANSPAAAVQPIAAQRRRHRQGASLLPTDSYQPLSRGGPAW